MDEPILMQIGTNVLHRKSMNRDRFGGFLEASLSTALGGVVFIVFFQHLTEPVHAVGRSQNLSYLA